VGGGKNNGPKNKGLAKGSCPGRISLTVKKKDFNWSKGGENSPRVYILDKREDNFIQLVTGGGEEKLLNENGGNKKRLARPSL